MKDQLSSEESTGLDKEKKKRKKRERKEKKKKKRKLQQQQLETPESKPDCDDALVLTATRKRKLDPEGTAEERGKGNAQLPRLNSSRNFRVISAPNEIVTDENSSKKPTSKERHPFQADEADHCETPLRAYHDILPVLSRIAQGLGKDLKDLIIYDPYYCDGGVQRKLNSLGCHKVINENRDFYHDITADTIPDHDVILTNPPYSGDHMESLLKFVSRNHIKPTTTGNKKKTKPNRQQQPLTPFLLLLPHYVYTKTYFLEYFESDARGIASNTLSNLLKLFYLVPKNNYRYSYEPPLWVSHETGSNALSKGKTQTAPFPSFWYCHVPSLMSKDGSSTATYSWLTETFGESGQYRHHMSSIHNHSTKQAAGSSTLHYARCTSHLPREFKGEFDVTKKRPNPRARKRATKKKQQQQQTGAMAKPSLQVHQHPKYSGNNNGREAKRKKKRY